MPALTFDALYKSIRKGEIPGAIYLYGAEDVLKDELIAEVVARALDPGTRDFNLDVRSATSLDPDQVEALCGTLPMMAERRVVVVRDVEAWNKRAKAKAAILHWLGRPAPETILILVQGGAEPERDPDLAAATSHAAAEPLTIERAKKWLLVQAARLGIVLEDDAASHLVRVTDGGLGLLQSELAKLSGLAGAEPLTLERVASLLGVRHGETQYDWRDAVLEGKAGPAAALLQHLLGQTGVTGVSLVTLIGTSLIGLGLARAHWDRGLRGGPLVQAIKSSLFRSRPQRVSFEAAANQWSRLVPSWPPARIERAIKRALEADLRLKNTAVSDERAILFDLVMEISLPWQAAA